MIVYLFFIVDFIRIWCWFCYNFDFFSKLLYEVYLEMCWDGFYSWVRFDGGNVYYFVVFLLRF